MNPADVYPLAASVVGFVAAICFCAGAAANSAKQIRAQSSTHWNFNKHLAHSLCVQRAQYVVGAILLVISFSLQSASVLGVFNVPLSVAVQSAFTIFFVMLGLTSAFASMSVKLIVHVTEKRVLELCEQEEAEYKAERNK